MRFALLPDGQDPDDLLRSVGRDAMDRFIRTARPLSDMVWSRETEGAVFDTPERRAELENRMRGLTRIMTFRRFSARPAENHLQSEAAAFPARRGRAGLVAATQRFLSVAACPRARLCPVLPLALVPPSSLRAMRCC